MAISPVNIARISQNLQTSLMLESIRRSQRELFHAQARIATGRQFVTPSEDPVAAARSLDLSQALLQQQQFRDNAVYGENFLSAADSALAEIADLLIQASAIASQTVGSLTSADEREAEAEVVASIRQQLQIVGNRQFNGRYIFAGRDTLEQPFIDGPIGVIYVGDTGELLTRLSQDLISPISMPGSTVFGALSDRIVTNVDLSPILTDSTRLDDITGATGRAVRTGTLVFNEIGGAGVFMVNLDTADTIGDVIDAINAAAQSAGAAITAVLTDTGVEIRPNGSSLTVTDTSAGATAASLGILTTTPTSSTIAGAPLTARVTRLTSITALAGGAGVDLSGGLLITNGSTSATIDLSTAETVQDIINAINNAGVSVLARINDAGTGIDVFNLSSETSLSIGENGGTTAAELGIRTFDQATPLSSLNSGLGVDNVEGANDLRIMAANGSTVDVNLDGTLTLGDAIDAINDAAQAAGVNLTAALTGTGNGIELRDGTGGSGTLSVSRLNLSNAAEDLGLLDGTVTASTLIGVDTNPTRSGGIMAALLDLERALRADDTGGITLAGQRIDLARNEATRMHGIIGARAQAMSAKRLQTEDAAQSTEIFLSEVRDLDYTEAISRLTATTAQFEAGLRTSAIIGRLSLLDFLQ